MFLLLFCLWARGLSLETDDNDGVWSAWEPPFLTCSNGIEYESRWKICGDNLPCPEQILENRIFALPPCSSDGAWGAWSIWSIPAISCSNIVVTESRFRKCDNPAPVDNGMDCPGLAQETKPLNLPKCPIDGVWGSWSDWSGPKITCSDVAVTESRKRTCDKPVPSNNGKNCQGLTQETRPLNIPKCPIDGVWGIWSAWSGLMITCSNVEVTVSRNRNCDAPSPANNGKNCQGISLETKSSNLPKCPIDGGWGDWTTWSVPQITCSEVAFRQIRVRKCDKPVPSNNGRNCPGSAEETKSRSLPKCPIDGAWGEWSNWSGPRITCLTISVTESRVRKCDRPAPANNGKNCPGFDKDMRAMNLPRCPINGAWGIWTAWSGPMVTCSDVAVTQRRFRICDNPSPRNNGLDCPNSGQETRPLNIPKCPIDGKWGEWAPWSGHRVSCSRVYIVEARKRKCDKPPPAFNGKICPGNALENRNLYYPPCPIRKRSASIDEDLSTYKHLTTKSIDEEEITKYTNTE